MQPSIRDDAHSPHARASHITKDLRFLVVEDHQFQRTMMVEMLKSLGVTLIDEAADGFSALELIRASTHTFHVIVTDIDMPGMDGMAFIRRLGEAKVLASLVITSGLDTSLLQQMGAMSESCGMRLLGTVEKPPTLERFADLIEMHMRATSKPPNRKQGIQPSFTLQQVLKGLEGNQFEPYYQPKIELKTRRVTGAEALARWRHPYGGVVLPNAFISVLEEAGQISELTWIMLAKSARDCHDWREAGLDLNVSVNISLKLLEDPAVADAVTWQVTHQGLDPKYMTLEIAESGAMSGMGQVLENLLRLRMRGFGLSIDDFGTGYSSMQQLTRIPFTELKIDKIFIAQATHQESSRTVLESSLEMTRKLGITSVAQGVETSQDWDLLRDYGCDLAQGFLIANPMKSTDFPAWVRAWT